VSLLKSKPTYPTDKVREKVARRVARLSEAEMLDWADVAGSGIARTLREYHRSHEPELLTEAREAISALQGVIDTLAEREVRAK
jgi:hypothetical protein